MPIEPRALSLAMADDFIRDIEHRFDVSWTVYVAQVCSPKPHSAAPISAGAFDVHITTHGADTVTEFNTLDPAILAKRVVDEVRTLVPSAA
ncbi:MAG: hypothetical protein ABJB01_07160 [Rudaea sp.]